MLAWAAIGTAVVAVARKVANLTKSSIDYADNIGDLAAKYGLTTDSISEMQYIADQSSTSIEGLTSAMTMLLNRAKEDGEAFQKLGVSVTDADGNFKAMDELFYETIGALNSIENEGEKSALMLETFGRSAMSVGEVVRKSSEELAQMRQEAHDFGVVLQEETINYASDLNDTLAVLKLQGQSALASLVAGAPDAEQKLSQFFDNVLKTADTYLPAFMEFGVRLVVNVALEMVRIAPEMVILFVETIIDVIMSTDWRQVGIDIAKSILEGLLNLLGDTLKTIGIDIPRVDLGVRESTYVPQNVAARQYGVSTKTTHEINLNVEATGDTPVSQETAEKTAEALAPYIDRILGGR